MRYALLMILLMLLAGCGSVRTITIRKINYEIKETEKEIDTKEYIRAVSFYLEYIELLVAEIEAADGNKIKVIDLR